LDIASFGFRICFGFRASDFVLLNAADREASKNGNPMGDLIQPTTPGLDAVAPQAATRALALARPGAEPAALEKAAKDFESVLLNTLLGEMGKTIDPSGLLDSPMTEQVQGIFWFYLGQDLAQRGGLGLWKDIVRHLPSAAGAAPTQGPSRSEPNR
jgi:Rod binding domain-containing protein